MDSFGPACLVAVSFEGVRLALVDLLRVHPTAHRWGDSVINSGEFPVIEGMIDELGGVQAPGTAYTISGDGIEAGEYVLICFIPNSEGVLHAQLGMVSGFTIAEGDANQAPQPAVTYTISDDHLDGPTELAAGDTAIEIVNDSSTNREITLFKVKEGSTLDDVGAFFEAADEGPPDFASGPIDFLAFVFDGTADRTITVNLTAGQWVLQTPDPEQPFEGDPTQDPHTTLITVS